MLASCVRFCRNAVLGGLGWCHPTTLQCQHGQRFDSYGATASRAKLNFRPPSDRNLEHRYPHCRSSTRHRPPPRTPHRPDLRRRHRPNRCRPPRRSRGRMTHACIRREGQRPAQIPAQGNALGIHASFYPSPEGATQTRPNGSAAPSGLTEFNLAYPGRCPGLSWTGPLALSESHAQGQRPDRIQPRATPWVIRTALISAAVTGQIDVAHLAEAGAA